ncbi:hypothetical protein C0J52_12475 [Blattella germanica]|nr:hypothetical protein C0J52_12475 [Blattella germanica]
MLNKQLQGTLILLLAIAISFTSGQNNTSNDTNIVSTSGQKETNNYVIRGGSRFRVFGAFLRVLRGILDIRNDSRVKTLFAGWKEVIRDMFGQIIDMVMYLIATSPSPGCKVKKQEGGPIRKILKNVPILIKYFLSARWGSAVGTVVTMFTNLPAVIKKVYVTTASIKKNINFITGILKGIWTFFALLANFVFSMLGIPISVI